MKGLVYSPERGSESVYSDSFYAASLDGRFGLRPSTADEWQQAEQLPITRQQIVSSRRKAPSDPQTHTDDGVLYRDKVFPRSGNFWGNLNTLTSTLREQLGKEQWEMESYGMGGNGATGPRSSAVARSRAFSVLSKSLGVAGSGFSLFQGVQSYRAGNKSAAAKGTLDAGMALVGAFEALMEPWRAPLILLPTP